MGACEAGSSAVINFTSDAVVARRQYNIQVTCAAGCHSRWTNLVTVSLLHNFAPFYSRLIFASQRGILRSGVREEYEKIDAVSPNRKKVNLNANGILERISGQAFRRWNRILFAFTENILDIFRGLHFLLEWRFICEPVKTRKV